LIIVFWHIIYLRLRCVIFELDNIVIICFYLQHTFDSDPEVREAAYAALGSAMRTIGEKSMMTLLTAIADDKLKITKVSCVSIFLYYDLLYRLRICETRLRKKFMKI
jgi:hypothetical protein